jgi:hypothetical protein
MPWVGDIDAGTALIAAMRAASGDPALKTVTPVAGVSGACVTVSLDAGALPPSIVVIAGAAAVEVALELTIETSSLVAVSIVMRIGGGSFQLRMA